jgi:hypothetical protein
MYFELKAVSPQDDYMLLLTFENGEQRLFDMKPLLNKGIFRELKDPAMFNTVRVCFHSIAWKNEADLAPEILYPNSTELNKTSCIYENS